jgi:hypothetical protein
MNLMSSPALVKGEFLLFLSPVLMDRRAFHETISSLASMFSALVVCGTVAVLGHFARPRSGLLSAE